MAFGRLVDLWVLLNIFNGVKIGALFVNCELDRIDLQTVELFCQLLGI